MKRNVFSESQFEIQTSNQYRIPVSSGVTLGATITRPVTNGRFPALVWYDPYRSCVNGKPDAKSIYFAQRGYAFVHLNVRGTGNSSGYSTDEYTIHETQDGVDAIGWLGQQSWCTGKVGMLGASYSGFNTLQVASEAPPELKAIAPAYFTDRRYTDDCHYKGGCLRGYYDFMAYGLSMVGMNGLPPLPEAAGSDWSDIWQTRLEKCEPYLLKWFAHQTEDPYWAVGSIAGHYHKIKAASMLLAGWNDGYLNPPFRVFEQLAAPKKLLIGPWSHTYPDESHCGPRIDIHFELLRWWDYWLKEMDNGVMDEPAVQLYEREHEDPITNRLHIAGQWRMASDLPKNEPITFHLNEGQATEQPLDSVGQATVPYLPAASRNGGMWDAGTPFMLPGEQSEDSARAVNFETAVLTEDLSIFGNPTFDLTISSDVPVIPIAVRLLDVSADGTKVLVTKGILNGTRRNGMETPEPLIPNEKTQVAFHLEATGWRFKAGHRIQISINGSDFPNVWPTPYKGKLTVHWGKEHPSKITLPVWDGGDEPSFELLPSTSNIRPFGTIENPWKVTHDVLEDRYRLQTERGMGTMCVSNRNPAEAWINATHRHVQKWAGAEIVSEAEGMMTSNETHFVINIALNVTMNGKPYFQKRWSQTYERELL